MVWSVLFAVALAATNVSTAKSQTDVEVGGITLRVPFPSGYCMPKGSDVAEFQRLAAPDQKNITLLSLVACRRTETNKYLLMKAPVIALDTAVDRAEMIKELSEAFVDPDLKSEIGSIPNEVGTARSKATGVPTEISGKYIMRGHDDICVYFGGTMTTTKANKTQDQAVGSCLTVVGARFVALHSYEDTDDPQAYKALLPILKIWATKIRSVENR